MKGKIHIVTVHGKKPPYHDSDGYYHNISGLADWLEERYKIPFFTVARYNDKGSALFDITSTSKGFADELAKRLRKFKRYERVEVNSLEVDQQEIDRMFSA